MSVKGVAIDELHVSDGGESDCGEDSVYVKVWCV